MTELLYQTDSYLKEFSATILSVDSESRSVVLDRSAFYPGGGGQPCDFGALEVAGIRYPVEKVKKQGDDVLHFLGGTEPLPTLNTASRCAGTLDWVRRHQLMRTHTALHILCGTVFRDYGAKVTGGDMDPLKGRMDFEFETMRGELVRDIEAAVNLEVQNRRDIRVKILPREEAFQIPDLIRTKINLLPEGISQVRTVEIVGLDLQADGGTHVMNTSEVGRVKVVDYKSKGAINKRIYIEIE
ncbi:MAG: alanyl-tRNA editing protein [Anaerolineales bacterium]|uniref:alanyl-tRNA editing protein n=1 Tax=Candidatus Villigracilis affinis TaxID=3140682 RepID=UPI001DCCD3D1|nr:alanyl-tRNA editing protein [Anaerolineales bacterium]MBK9601204.1 alanyl-tRNA editing protein [Anaerolineales bacterium]MBL0347591.1 alanyl-tRNA editing protein [Anaerolineales bacterium]